MNRCSDRYRIVTCTDPESWYCKNMKKPLFASWSCPRVCGWTRNYATDEHMNDTFTHPLYGEVTNRECALLDIQSHNCVTYRSAHLRAMQRRSREYAQVYAHQD